MQSKCSHKVLIYWYYCTLKIYKESPRPYLNSKFNLLFIFLSEFKRIYKKLKTSKYAIFKAILKIGIFFYIQEKLFWLLINSRKLPYFSLESISGKFLYEFLEFLESQKLFISNTFIVFQKIERRTELNGIYPI